MAQEENAVVSAAQEQEETRRTVQKGPAKSFLGMSKEKLRHLKVADKFGFTFNRLLIMIGIMVVALGVSIGLLLVGVTNMYTQYLQMNAHNGKLSTASQSLAKNILYSIATGDQAVRVERINLASSDLETAEAELNALSEIYPNKEDMQVTRDYFEQVRTGGQDLMAVLTTEPVDTALAHEIFRDELLPPLASVVQELNKITSYVDEQSAFIFRMILIVTIPVIILAVILVILSYFFIRAARRSLTDSIVEPVTEIAHAADKMAEGHLAVNIDYESDDELGGLSNSMQHMTKVLHGIVEDLTDVMRRLGGGDLVHGSKNPDCYIGDFYPIAKEIRSFRDSLAGTMGEIKDSSSQVSQGAQNMAQGAQDLAEGSTDQASSVQQLTASVASVMSQTESLADSADKGNRMAGQVKNQADMGIEKMGQVVEAMESITQSSNQIASIIQTIEDIASQTNLLSLNASIEAARAGEAGKGFAVVADEIRQLAAQSGEAAGHIREVIQTTVDSVNHGNTVVEETNEALGQVAQSITEIQSIMQENSEEASNQKAAMEEINRGIEQISQVVQANSATAEESNAISEELSAQSQSLNALINKFEIGEG
ncbi:MAG: HAMP domain-containing protein [Lachnospiraceae bacterium]|nr:HAMP domain-containing protein [Lachnospiraceae bacterium]